MHLDDGSAPAAEKAYFTLPVRVYYEDTDAGGVVYYANYLKFCERARTDWLRAFGIGQNQLASESAIAFVVRSVKADYHLPAVLDDLLEVVSTLSKLGRASMIFDQQIKRDGHLLFEAQITIACIDGGARRAVAIPAKIHAQLATLV